MWNKIQIRKHDPDPDMGKPHRENMGELSREQDAGGAMPSGKPEQHGPGQKFQERLAGLGWDSPACT